MTPDQIDAAANAAVELAHMVDTFGPGIALTLGAAAAYWGLSRGAGALHDRISHRRDVRRGLRRLTQYANPGGSRQLLDEIHQPRKEAP
ncbi:hypothetical protein AB0D91_05505 [Streptomyces canus]|uniref:hypothetical protein n=1 Tax=Streptomyces canus TaxID=58343 RepID=UPI0033C48099